MKKLVIALTFLASFSFANAQTSQVDLAQSPGVFTQTDVNLEAGSYQFNIANTDVDHEVGFVLVPKGKYDQANHIKAAYVTAPVPTGSSSKTGIVDLKPGEYEYFCPLNPTPKYSLTVHGKVETVKLTQVPGKFEKKKVKLDSGAPYKFEIANDGVDHEVGFVLVPKGKYAPENHIKAAYVTSTVPNGSSSLTSVVSLPAGEYEYFCPMNPTPKYGLTVK